MSHKIKSMLFVWKMISKHVLQCHFVHHKVHVDEEWTPDTSYVWGTKVYLSYHDITVREIPKVTRNKRRLRHIHVNSLPQTASESGADIVVLFLQVNSPQAVHSSTLCARKSEVKLSFNLLPTNSLPLEMGSRWVDRAGDTGGTRLNSTWAVRLLNSLPLNITSNIWS
jgi:hypothetical protein